MSELSLRRKSTWLLFLHFETNKPSRTSRKKNKGKKGAEEAHHIQGN
jgi:hypothetical protein